MDIYSFLDQHDITYQRFDHPAVFTCEQANKLRTRLRSSGASDGQVPMPGKDTKNLFLRDKKGKRHFLVTVGHEKQVDLKTLTEALQVQQGLSFASPERLKTHLGVEPGSVTLLGVVNDSAHAVEVIIDDAVWNADAVCAHPLVNTATLCIPHEGLVKFLAATGHEPRILSVPEAQKTAL